MANISQQKRQKMLEFLNKLKQEHQDDDSLRALGEIETALNEKKYGLVWEKHTEKVDEMLEHNIPVFCEDKSKKIVANENDSYNFLLEGDNLHSLKLLEKTHKGKIDVIYIDPPYNTGNKHFIYNDNFVGKTDGYSHSKWLSFMSERLEIARELLSDDGVIFISIDDNEQAQLKLLCDEVFGEENFIENFCWNKTTTPQSLSNTSRVDIDYILTYQKKKTNKIFKSSRKDIKSTDSPLESKNNPIGILKFPPRSVNFKIKDGIYSKSKYSNGKLLDDVIVKNGFNENEFSYKSNLKWSQEYLNEELKNETKILIKTNKFSIRYLKLESRKKIMAPNKLIDGKFGVGTNDNAKLELKKLNIKFTYSKPISLLKYLINFFNSNNIIVLDFFAGSGTTGHAVMQLNKEDGGNRNYILCTNNENNICEEVTYRRLKNIQDELPHNLKYFKTDFISKYESDEDEETISEKMLEHIKELIELEHHIEIDNEKYIILDDEDELDKTIENIKEGGKLFITSGIFLSRTHQRILDDKNVTVVDIPEYYYRSELKEVGEL